MPPESETGEQILTLSGSWAHTCKDVVEDIHGCLDAFSISITYVIIEYIFYTGHLPITYTLSFFFFLIGLHYCISTSLKDAYKNCFWYQSNICFIY